MGGIGGIIVFVGLLVMIGRAFPPIGIAVLFALFVAACKLIAEHYGWDGRWGIGIGVGAPVGLLLGLAGYGLWLEYRRK